MPSLKHTILHSLSKTETGECLTLLASNAWRAVKTPVYPTSLEPQRFEAERDRLWKHINQLLPLAGYEASEHGLLDQRVLVVGVGSTFGFALLLLALGAKKVVCIDPFLRTTDRLAEERFSETLAASIPWPAARARAEAHMAMAKARQFPEGFLIDGDKIRFHRVALEPQGGALDGEGPFDLIISNAVLEHLYDVDLAMRRFKQLLSTTGGMAHGFAFMSHELFSRVHSQQYLTSAPWLWRLMTSNGSPPNRMSLSHFRRAASSAGFSTATFSVLESYSAEETEYALRHAHPSVVADNAEDMSAYQVVFRVPRRQ